MIILDTNVISELMLERPHQAVLLWWDNQVIPELNVTSVVEAELRNGATQLPEGRRRTRLSQSIDLMLATYFPDRIPAFDSLSAREYANIMAHRRAIGKPMDNHPLDIQIAAIARSNGASVATRNVRDFTDCGIQVINPWETGGTA